MKPGASKITRGVFAIALALLLSTACGVESAPVATERPVATEIPVTTVAQPVSEEGDPNVAFDVQGHRGARGLKPENTLPAFETALDLGVTTLELDLHLTADGVAVVWHDAQIDNSKCGLRAGAEAGTPDPDDPSVEREALMISALTFEQLQGYQCDRNPDADRFGLQDNQPTALAGDDYGVISLAELFEFVENYGRSEVKSASQRENAANVYFNLETKREPDEPETINDSFDGQNPGQFELEMLEQIEAYGLRERAVIQSFDHRSLWAIHSVDDKIRLAALTARGRPELGDFAEAGAGIWSPDYRVLTAALVEEAHRAGLQVIPWTVSEAPLMGALIEMGVDGIISDRPDVLLDVIGGEN
jgi:glycerophosphoryl diester phosphodiesterase